MSTIAPGARLGPYEILAAIGAGGMGEVYRARDTRLDRTVAIKVLPETLASNSQLRLRFEREAKAISALAHPNICTLHDVGSDNGVQFLVMEHLEGETLAERLSRGALSVDEALRIGIQIADALDKAHRRGIVHRDLKPGNVMLTRGGAKLLDFGLARSIDTETISPDSLTIAAPTAAKPLTEEGTIVGTFQYMAPEQLEGRTADARTDIFALGTLLYEMLTGKRAFDGKSRASVIAAILAAEPQPVSAIQPLTPASLERVIRICLRKDPDERWQSAHDVKLELEALAVATDERVTPKRRSSLAGWIAAALVALGAIAYLLYDRRTNHQPLRTVRFEIAPPEGGYFDLDAVPVTLSPDGARFVIRSTGATGESRLLLRSFDSTDYRVLPGTEAAYDAFWSPDGRHVGFFTTSTLKRVDVTTGAVLPICSVSDGRAASWSKDGVIVLGPGLFGPLFRVPATGGALQQVTKLDASRKEVAHWRPWFLPDGRHFLFFAVSASVEQSGVYVGSLDSPEVKRVLDVISPAVYVEPGTVFYMNNGSVYAQPFDAKELRASGEPVLVAKDVAFSSQYAVAGYSVANNGMFAWHRNSAQEWQGMSRMPVDGGPPVTLGVHGHNTDLSRDDTRVIYQSHEGLKSLDIWMYDLRRNVSSRVTFEPGNEVGPVWSPDGSRVAYVSLTSQGASLRIGALSGATHQEVLPPRERSLEVVDWSRDGRTLLLEATVPDTRIDLLTVDLASRKVSSFTSQPFSEDSGRFSPDGKWIAYISDESGRREMYVQPFPPDGSKWQVTNGGGESPRWSAGGKTLFYITPGLTLMSVAVDTANGFETGTARTHANVNSTDVLIRGDGHEVIVAPGDNTTDGPIVITTNWKP